MSKQLVPRGSVLLVAPVAAQGSQHLPGFSSLPCFSSGDHLSTPSQEYLLFPYCHGHLEQKFLNTEQGTGINWEKEIPGSPALGDSTLSDLD